MSSARPFYYLENFCGALEWLKGRYADLMHADELQFIATMSELPRTCAGLLVRMIMRRGDLFRLSTLHYEEIGPVHGTLPTLIDLKWLDPRPTLSLQQLCGLLRRDELQRALSLRKKPVLPRGSERQLDFGFRDCDRRALEDWWRDATDQVLQVRIAGLCRRLRLMFFGNFHQDWSAFVLSDLGIHRYETVCLDGSSRAFQSREQIEQFEQLYELHAQLQEEVCADELLSAIPSSLPECDWIESCRARLLMRIGQQSERSGDLQSALRAYASCNMPEARVRTIRILERTGQLVEARARLEQAEAAWATELERQHAARIRPRLMRKLGLTSTARVAMQKSHCRTFEVELCGPEGCASVERQVRNHLQQDGSRVFYVENSLVNSLFGLLFWKAIFAPVPGAFFHPFQAQPIDLLEPAFCARRSRVIEDCLRQLEDGTYRDTINTNFASKTGLASPFVAWGLMTPGLLELSLGCIPAPHLRALFLRLLCDLGSHRTGLPDLIQFWPQEYRYRMIEVKGPGDRLQDNQIRWLAFCARNNIAVELCKVRWQAHTRQQSGTQEKAAQLKEAE